MTLVRNLVVGVLSIVATTSVSLAQAIEQAPATPTTPITYRGPLSFGGTVAVTVDAPNAGQVQVRFEDSPFGLQGTIVGNYTTRYGESTVRQFAADASDPPSEAVVGRLRGAALRFTRNDDRLSGGISGLPNLALPARTARLAGILHATAAQDLPALASIAGIYTFVRHQEAGTPSRAAGNTKLGLDTGQFRIERSGAMWPCNDDGCLAPAAGSGAFVQKLEPADQTRWPGAFAVITDGKPGGRMYVSGKTGDATQDLTLYVANTAREVPGAGIGSIVMRTGESVASTLPYGRWRCQHPAMRPDPQTGSHAYRGTLQTETLDMTGPSVRNRDMNRPVQAWQTVASAPTATGSGGVAARGAANAIKGLSWVRWTPQRHQAFLPLDASTMAYALQSTAPVSSLDQMGICHRQRTVVPRSVKRPGKKTSTPRADQ
ncbi:hypothetical protein [Cupriavidus pampae]|uniref:Uncharacterized protein n=1 Tax=Cupriavidus pampae TaxID=659251 RepID=A0ABM8WA47_9BURK|nr:hypothetical protein [Cupriavidus pampae]CAG9164106.1 hypothetical protein LMG32289_00444 [Cupriavidus pampae]